MVISQTPFRISFFGGGTDYPGWYNENRGKVISVTFNKYSYVSLSKLPSVYTFKSRIRYYLREEINNINNIKHPTIRNALKFYKLKNVDLNHLGEFPANSGIGSSAAFTVGLINCIYEILKKKADSKTLYNEAIHIEQKLNKEPVGSQDQVAVASGGFNIINFDKKRIYFGKNLINEKIIKQIEESTILFYTGIQRVSFDTTRNLIKNIEKNFKIFDEVLKITSHAEKILYSTNFLLKEFGELLDISWNLKKKMSSTISNTKIDLIYKEAISAGALGGKILGAGNGGFFLVFAEKKNQKKIVNSLKGLQPFYIKFTNTGSRIIYNSNE
jgi:D-glycero-alpha-D-manno-heptose-7-phosphate kinase